MSPEQMKDKPMPSEMKRFSYGGFEVLVDVEPLVAAAAEPQVVRQAHAIVRV
jgi:hypothetical protein